MNLTGFEILVIGNPLTRLVVETFVDNTKTNMFYNTLIPKFIYEHRYFNDMFMSHKTIA